MKELDGAFVKVGFPAGGQVGEPSKKGSGSKPYSDMSEVARIAVWNEFGAKIEHKGGTSYRSMSIQGRIITRFIKNSMANIYDKKTGAHTIIIPARPFFRAAIDTNRDKVRDFQDRLSMDVMVGALKPKQALESLGLFMEDKIKKSLTTGAWAPNAKSTRDRKGSSRPLIDTGQMRNSVTFTTHKKGEPCEAEGSVVM